MLRVLFAAVAVTLVACGGGDSTGPGSSNDGGSTDGATADQSSGPDAGNGADGGARAGDAAADAPADAHGEAEVEAAADAPVDAPGDASLGACMSPADCGAATPLCCGSWTTGPGTFPSCPVELNTYTVGCKATCVSNFPLMCSAMTTARLCQKKSECTEPGYTECCIFGSDAGTSPSMCVSTFAKPYAQSCAP
jgi:hypothetical protein